MEEFKIEVNGRRTLSWTFREQAHHSDGNFKHIKVVVDWGLTVEAAKQIRSEANGTY